MWQRCLMTLLLISVIATAECSSASPKVYYVTQSGGDVPGGWSGTIDSAKFYETLSTAGVSDVFYVAVGVYQPAKSRSFVLRSGVKLYGGFAGTESGSHTHMLAARDIKSNTTLLKGNGASVLTSVNTSSQPLIDGFAISEGGGTIVSSNRCGGGIYNSNSSPVITNCTFYNNKLIGNGGGIYNSNCSPVITSCTFYNNGVNGNGGGIYNSNSSPVITNSTFTANSAYNGGGIYNTSLSSPKLVNCSIIGNNGTQMGGGIYSINSTPAVTNCILWDNSAVSDLQINTLTGTDRCVIQGWSGGGSNNSGTDPIVGTLAYNGGHSKTVAISRYIGGTSTGAPLADQRGVVRADPPCVGAYEYTARVTASVSGDLTHGAVSPEKSDIIHNGTLNLTITPKEGYRAGRLLVSMDERGYQDRTEDITYDSGLYRCRLSGIKRDHDVRVLFDPAVFNITAVAAGGHGSVVVAESIKYGESLDFTVTPVPGYAIGGLSSNVGHITQNRNGGYTLSGVTADAVITVTFSRERYSVRIITGSGGSIIKADNSPVLYGEDHYYIVRADNGYLISQVILDGVEQRDAAGGESFVCTLSDVRDNSRIVAATFRPRHYAATDEPGVGGNTAHTGGSSYNFRVDAIYGLVVVLYADSDGRVPPTRVDIPLEITASPIRAIVDRSRLNNIGLDVIRISDRSMIISGEPNRIGRCNMPVKLDDGRVQELCFEVAPFKKTINTLLDLSGDRIKECWRSTLSGSEDTPYIELLFPIYLPTTKDKKVEAVTVSIAGITDAKSEITTDARCSDTSSARQIRVTGFLSASMTEMMDIDVKYRVGALEYSQSGKVRLTDTSVTDRRTESRQTETPVNSGGCDVGFGASLLLIASISLGRRFVR